MHQQFIPLSEDSYIEVTTRLFDGESRIVLALRGTQDNDVPALASVVLNPKEVRALAAGLQDILQKVESEEQE
jgi:hypothetical protein